MFNIKTKKAARYLFCRKDGRKEEITKITTTHYA